MTRSVISLMYLAQAPSRCTSQMTLGSLSFTGHDGHCEGRMMGRAKWYTKWLLCSISAWCRAHLLCRAHSCATFPSVLIKADAHWSPGALFSVALTQLGHQVLLLLRVLWCPHPIILNPLSVIIGFRNTPQPQPWLCFLSASDGWVHNHHLISTLST